MLRIFDIFISLFLISCLSPLLVLICIISLVFKHKVFFQQERLGRDKLKFMIFKFRTMKLDTKDVATHLLDESQVTPVGTILRRTKLDELPQLWNVLKGDMSLVGPRPCLPTQKELIKARDNLRVFAVRPGITGLAQINGIDMSQPKLLAKTDARMLENLSTFKYFNYIFFTALGKGYGDRLNGK